TVSSENSAAPANSVRKESSPSQLKITDLRVTQILPGRWIVRIDTNQGLSGLGEIRDQASPTYALMLKSRILGENPCHIDRIFRKLKQFGNHGRQAGGVVAIEMACCDLAGKAWGVPCWQLLGGQFRNRVRLYADTPFEESPEEMARKLQQRMDAGYTFLKMDLSLRVLKNVPGALSCPEMGDDIPFQQYGPGSANIEHPFTGIRITERGLAKLAEYVAVVRRRIGWEIPLAADHFGHFCIEDGIKLAKALEPFNLAWLEDMVPWKYTDQYLRLRDACNTPVLTGEDIYLKEGFADLFDRKAIAICHPDLATAGGLFETKKIGDLAMERGIAMALHMAGSPIHLLASVHCAAATENFLALEHHSFESPHYEDLVVGIPKPFMDETGHMAVPDSPGLGIELNAEAVRESLSRQGLDPVQDYFPASDEWNDERAHDRLWSFRTRDQHTIG
ncbi:MAG: mandelate racemase/muconate lactonizing enzyme family protein, partial [Planctomycetaceae bacterium]|nr:mandelate racemase/muconate lactonizing enzyme family protein [Planctomycetaceae bacterium]